MPFNIYAVLVAALVTLAIGFIWYNPKVFGTIWMKETGMTEEKAQQGNMAKIFGLTIFYSLLLALMLPQIVNHEVGAMQAAGGNDQDPALIEFLKVHTGKFRSFKHGLLHGILAGVFFALPITAINALFEQKSWKYILVNAGFWIVSLGIMGAIICGWK
jgi:hypothetical protein